MIDPTAGMSMEMMKAGSLGLTTLGLFVSTWAVTSDPSSFLWRYSNRYTGSMERKLRLMFIFTKGSTILLGQFGAVFLLLFAQVLVGIPYWGFGLLAILAGPAFYIEKMRRDRVEALEMQLDMVILALANALKTTPSIGAAFQSIVNVIMEPFKSEVELAVKEMKVGSSLDQALLHMASRIGSRPVDSALSAVLIGRQVGGNLPTVLETTAATLREMARLDGVVRTKTAEGKAQLWVLGGLPAFLVGGMSLVWKGYFDPLSASILGYILTTICVVLWITSIVWARKILNVDI